MPQKALLNALKKSNDRQFFDTLSFLIGNTDQKDMRSLIGLVFIILGCAPPILKRQPFREPQGAELHPVVSKPTSRGWAGNRFPWEFAEDEDGLRISSRRWTRDLWFAQGGTKASSRHEPVWSPLFERRIFGYEILDPYGETSFWTPPGTNQFWGISPDNTIENKGVVFIRPKGVDEPQYWTKPRDQHEVRIYVPQTQLLENIKPELWRWKNETFRFYNLGKRSKSIDQPIIDAAYAEHKANLSLNNKMIVIDPSFPENHPTPEKRSPRQSVISILTTIRSNLLAMVVQIYAKTHKGEERDILSFSISDDRSDATDQFVILRDGNYTLETLDAKTLTDKAIVTLQLHRDRIENFDIPTEIQSETGVFSLERDPLAFERRLRLKNKQPNISTMKRFRELRGSRNVGEFTRYAAFDRLPRALRNALWCKAFDAAVTGPHPLGMLVFTVGPNMKKALADLEFEEVGPIKTLHTKHETLMYIHTDSETFKRVHTKLRENSILAP